MDGLAIMMVNVPLFIPLVVSLGFNPVWFGVLMCFNIEIGLITPPVAFNLFLRAARGWPWGSYSLLLKKYDIFETA